MLECYGLNDTEWLVIYGNLPTKGLFCNEAFGPYTTCSTGQRNKECNSNARFKAEVFP